MRRQRTDIASWILVATWFFGIAAVTCILLLVHGILYLPWQDPGLLLRLVCVFALFGAYFAAIVVLDGRSDMQFPDRPILRTIVCGVLGAIATLLIQTGPARSFDTDWIAFNACIGAALGYLGWRWAKHVDF